VSADPQITAALIGAAAAVGVGLVTWVLGQITTLISYRWRRRDEESSSAERSRAVLHGSFSVCNFVAAKLNDWDETNSIEDLARLSVAQAYLATLIERSPHENEVLSVSLFGLGLQLENLMFLVGKAIGEGKEEDKQTIEKIDAAVLELDPALELLQLLLDPDRAFISDEELSSMVENPDEIPSAELETK